MAELNPIPLPLLWRRAVLEYEREGKIFDLPKDKFFRGLPELDLSVLFHRHRAATPLGPAAGPHGQLAQNIVLSWLGGSRIIELKTIQILDHLKIPRPCIDAENVGYNVEWSQELTLEQSLREYVGAAMFLEMLKTSGLLGAAVPSETVFDMSVGYNLQGIQSPRVRAWIESMKNASAVIDELREGLPHPFRDLAFSPAISDSVSLSTFHGCPAGEIERIVTFLLREMGCHVCLKLNPTLLGQAEVERLLHEVLGYREIQLHPPAFDSDVRFDEAADLIPRLQAVAASCRRSLSVKFTNTLVVKNHRGVFHDDLMYLSGRPLHVIALNLALQFRNRVDVPMSFSGGVDAHNFASIVGLGFVPVTTCTDLLRPGGYARMIRYLENLGTEMRALGTANLSDYVRKFEGRESRIVAEATANPRYGWEQNKGVPRKIEAKLWLYDCINCEKCVPMCPNDANFVYETHAQKIEYDNFELQPGLIRRVPGGVLRVVNEKQFANYADACNDCGNCEIFCPEAGGPNREKPRFFGSPESFRKHAGDNGFYIDWPRHSIYGVIAGKSFLLRLRPGQDRAWFETETAEVEIRLRGHEVVAWSPKPGSRPCETVNMLAYFKLKLLLEAMSNPDHVHFANVAGLEEVASADNVNR
jgi:putative selenate reductase